MEEATREERQHPDVRLVYPHLCGLRGFGDFDKYPFKPEQVLEGFKSAYGAGPFFPTRILDVPGRPRVEDDFDWRPNDEIERAEKNLQGRRPIFDGFRSWRPGEEQTIYNLASTQGDDRVLAFLYALVVDEGDSNVHNGVSLIYEALWTRLSATVWRMMKDSKIDRYHANIKHALPWPLSLRWGDRGDTTAAKAVRDLPGLLALIAQGAHRAQESWGLVRVRSTPDELAVAHNKRGLREALVEALRAFDAGDLHAARQRAGAAAHGIDLVLEQMSVCKRAKMD